MSQTAAVEKHEEWWSRETTATYLGVNFRKLRKLCQGLRIRRQHVPPGPGRPYQSMVYHAGDVKAYKLQAEAGDGSSNVPHVRAAEAPAAASAMVMTLLAERLAPPARVKRWLTIDEAVPYFGLPRAFLLRLTRTEHPGVLNVGTKARPRWRFDRNEL